MKTTSTETFKQNATVKHEGFYTYDKAVWVSNKTKLVITCPVHGDFEQSPNNHLTGYGCKACAIQKVAASQADSFVTAIVAELSSTRRTSRTVRIHESGDFYSQEYLDKWTAIAKLSPTFTFYAFTKRMKDFDFSIAKSLPNFIVIDSLQSGKLNYGKLSTLDQSKFICPSTLGQPVICGQSCKYCQTKTAQIDGVQFVKH